MALRASELCEGAVDWPALLAPRSGRLEFSLRLAVVCAATTLVAAAYGTPEPALTVYVVFFVMKSDRVTSVVMSAAMMVLMALVVGAVVLLSIRVIDAPGARVTAMATTSFVLLFAASASRLRPVAPIVGLIGAYGLDLLAKAQVGELATRAFLFAWLCVGIPATVSIVVNLAAGPAPRRLAERALAERLRCAARVLRHGDEPSRRAFQALFIEGTDEIRMWLGRARVERTSSDHDLAALRQATQSVAALLVIVDWIDGEGQDNGLAAVREPLAHTLDEMASIFDAGGYPVGITLEVESLEEPAIEAAVVDELRELLAAFARVPEDEERIGLYPPRGFWLPDAFTNADHLHYATKTTAAALICYVTYTLLDWPGIHTALITCYIVALHTTAETVEKLTLRIAGCLVGAAIGTATLVFVMPHVTSVGGLLLVMLPISFSAGWIIGGGPRISYAGFQLAFAFFLCVLQGAGPAFDLTIARDRVIGILFGNLVVYALFAYVWPVSVAPRIDRAMTAALRQFAALAAATTRPHRYASVARAQTELRLAAEGLELIRYESSLRTNRARIARLECFAAVNAIEAPLLFAAGRPRFPAQRIHDRLIELAASVDGRAQIPELPATLDPLNDLVAARIRDVERTLEPLVQATGARNALA